VLNSLNESGYVVWHIARGPVEVIRVIEHLKVQEVKEFIIYAHIHVARNIYKMFVL